jgi:hypothetical protein
MELQSLGVLFPNTEVIDLPLNLIAMDRKYDLEARLIAFAAAIISFTDSMINTKAGNHTGN